MKENNTKPGFWSTLNSRTSDDYRKSFDKSDVGFGSATSFYVKAVTLTGHSLISGYKAPVRSAVKNFDIAREIHDDTLWEVFTGNGDSNLRADNALDLLHDSMVNAISTTNKDRKSKLAAAKAKKPYDLNSIPVVPHNGFDLSSL